MKSKIKIGIIGCGKISDAYLKGCASYDILEIATCADLDLGRAQAKAAEFNITKGCSTEELIADPGIDLVVNLTIPKVHAEINLAAIAAGKHVWCEKPFVITREECRQVLEAARAKGMRVGSAPDTFLGEGIQTCRKLIDDGAIGEPVAATAFMAGHGHETWHPSPAFYYERGGGPMLDMGPYYLTALVNLIGPMRRVCGAVATTFSERTITSQPLAGTKIPVETPTHLTGAIDFQNGAIATVIMSFDVWAHHLPLVEIHGTEGSLSVPDPNNTGGEVSLRRSGAKEWEPIAHTHTKIVGRGVGVADMACAILGDRAHRASGDLAAHVVDAMLAFEESSESGRHIELTTTCEKPAAVPTGLPTGELDR